MIKMQLDWSALTGLIESNEGLLIEIKQGVKANFVKSYIKNIMDGNDVTDVQKQIIAELKQQVSMMIAETKMQYGRLKVVSIHSDVIKAIKDRIGDEVRHLVNDLCDEVMNEKFPAEEIERRINERVEVQLKKEVDRRIREKMVAVMQAASD